MKPELPETHWKRNAAALVTLGLAGGFGALFWQQLAERRTVPAVRPGTTMLATSAASLPPALPPEAEITPQPDSDEEAEILRAKGSVSGDPLPPGGLNPDQDKGRVLRVDPVAVRSWGELRRGSRITIPSVENDELLEGTVNLVLDEDGWLRIGGDLTGKKGTFTLSTDFNEVAGVVLLPEEKRAYEITMDGLDVVIVERRISTVVCANLPFNAAGAPQAAGAASTSAASDALQPTAPILNSRPGAKGVIFLVFDGETVTDPSWNGGKTIVAARAPLSAAQITEIVKAVTEDYAPFDMTVTTDRSVYDSTPAGLRMKTIITPTTTAAPGTGGYAYIGCWKKAGRSFKSDIPCWVFNIGQKVSAETISHEVGHTLGLTHDGQVSGSTYYSGHGGNASSPTSWAPIMGSGYSVNLVQWSKGEYIRANNSQDDLYLIGSQNGFGFIANGSASEQIRPLPYTRTTLFEGTGLLQRASDRDTLEFTTSGGTFTASVRPSSIYANVDEALELLDLSGATLAVSDLPTALTASLNYSLKPGTYRLVVRSAGTGPKPATGYAPGYSEYGSLGGYSLSGSLEGAVKAPVFLSSSGTLTATAGKPFSLKVGVSAGCTLSLSAGELPAGITFDSSSGTLAGTPTLDSLGGVPSKFTLSATNSEKTVTKDFTLLVLKDALPLFSAFSNATVSSTTAQAPWVGIVTPSAAGNSRIVAESGNIPNSTSSSVKIISKVTPDPKRAASWTLLTFWWKTSSEAGKDELKFNLNGIQAKDFNTGKPLVLSGETNWVKQTVRLENPAPTIEFVYTKDANLSSGRDRAWVYIDGIGQPPIISGQPPAVTTSPASSLTAQASFSLSAKVDGALSVGWIKDGVTLKDGTSSSGSSLSGTATGNLVISKAGAADAGTYWLQATNSAGVTSSGKAVVHIASAPVITQQIVPPAVLRIGDPLTLTIGVSGSSPFTYQWKKNGAVIATTTAPTYPVSNKTTASDEAKFSVTVSNALGSTTSTEVSIAFSIVK